MSRVNLFYLSHGGGPMPLLGDPGHRQMVESLQAAAKRLPRPSAILVVSAHWEEGVPTLTSGANPPLIYDYYGFPEESYSIEYPCPGEPVLADKVRAALEQAGIDSKLDGERGFDHGLFVPLKLMYPEADIPCVQLSLVNSLDARAHLAIGQALADLEYDNLLVIGSGFSFHNMRAFFDRSDTEADTKNAQFQDWLAETCAGADLTEAERTERLARWDQAPSARFCHPREEHLLPLHVCYGMAGRASDDVEPVTVLGKDSRMFYWFAS